MGSLLNRVTKQDKTGILLLILLFSLVYSFIGISKHNHFQTFGWDTAIFDQQVYLVSQLKLPYSSLHGFLGLGDHFHPLLYLVGGLIYKFWSDARALYILQSAMVSLSALPLYLLVKEVLKKTKLSKVQIQLFGILISLLYLFNVSMQFLAVGEYNDATSFPLPFLFTVYFLYKKNTLGFWLSFILMLLTKEEYSLLAVPLGLYIFLATKEYRKAVLVGMVGLVYFIVLTFYLMPWFANTKEYIFYSNSNRPSNILVKMVQNPSLFVTKFLDNTKKRETLLVSFSSFGFLPLVSPVDLIIPVSTLAVRLYDDTVPRRFEFNNQYAAGLVPPLAVATIFSIYRLVTYMTRRKVNTKLVVVLLLGYLLIVVLTQDILYHGPINSLLKPQFYLTNAWVHDTDDLIRQVPKGVAVAANNSLLPHLSQRENFYLLPKIGEAEFIAVDLAEGPNKFAPLDHKQMENFIDGLVVDKKYQIVWQKNQAFLLKKI